MRKIVLCFVLLLLSSVLAGCTGDDKDDEKPADTAPATVQYTSFEEGVKERGLQEETIANTYTSSRNEYTSLA